MVTSTPYKITDIYQIKASVKEFIKVWTKERLCRCRAFTNFLLMSTMVTSALYKTTDIYRIKVSWKEFIKVRTQESMKPHRMTMAHSLLMASPFWPSLKVCVKQ